MKKQANAAYSVNIKKLLISGLINEENYACSQFLTNLTNILLVYYKYFTWQFRKY